MTRPSNPPRALCGRPRQPHGRPLRLQEGPALDCVRTFAATQIRSISYPLHAVVSTRKKQDWLLIKPLQELPITGIARCVGDTEHDLYLYSARFGMSVDGVGCCSLLA